MFTDSGDAENFASGEASVDVGGCGDIGEIEGRKRKAAPLSDDHPLPKHHCVQPTQTQPRPQAQPWPRAQAPRAQAPRAQAPRPPAQQPRPQVLQPLPQAQQPRPHASPAQPQQQAPRARRRALQPDESSGNYEHIHDSSILVSSRFPDPK